MRGLEARILEDKLILHRMGLWHSFFFFFLRLFGEVRTAGAALILRHVVYKYGNCTAESDSGVYGTRLATALALGLGFCPVLKPSVAQETVLCADLPQWLE